MGDGDTRCCSPHGALVGCVDGTAEIEGRMSAVAGVDVGLAGW
jgi:hypothetical protein